MSTAIQCEEICREKSRCWCVK